MKGVVMSRLGKVAGVNMKGMVMSTTWQSGRSEYERRGHV